MATGIGVINLYLSWKPFPHEINHIVSEGTLQDTNGEEWVNSCI